MASFPYTWVVASDDELRGTKLLRLLRVLRITRIEIAELQRVFGGGVVHCASQLRRRPAHRKRGGRIKTPSLCRKTRS